MSEKTEQITLARKLGATGPVVMADGETMSMGYVDATSYTRTDVALAMVAAAYEAAIEAVTEDYIWGGESTQFTYDELCGTIRSRTPTDAKAALDRIVQEAVREALQVKPLVWTHHPMGLMASTGFGNAYIIDARDSPRIRWGKWPGGHGPERETLAEMQYAAQADYEARIRSALKGGEA